jgi:hypothetical protein
MSGTETQDAPPPKQSRTDSLAALIGDLIEPIEAIESYMEEAITRSVELTRKANEARSMKAAAKYDTERAKLTRDITVAFHAAASLKAIIATATHFNVS